MILLLPALTANLLGCVLLFLLYLYLYQTEREPCLRLWTVSWGLSVLRFALFLPAVADLPSAPVFRNAGWVVDLLSAYSMLLGTLLFVGKHQRTWWAWAFSAAGLWVLAGAAAGVSPVMQGVPVSILTCLIFVYTGSCLLRFRECGRGSRLMVGLTFIVWGVHKLDYPLTLIMPDLEPGVFLLAAIFELIVALGVVVMYFERAKLRLQTSESRYRLIAENTHDVIWVLDARTRRFLYVSPSVLKLRGFTAEEVMHQSLEQALTPESYASMVETLPGRLAAAAAGYEAAHVLTTRMDQPCQDGSVVMTEAVTTLLPGENGRGPAILGVSRDIRERVLAEQAREAASRFSQQIVSSAHEGIGVYDRKGRCVLWNASLETISGVPAAEAIGRLPDEAFPLPDTGIYRCGADIESALHGETVERPEILYQHRPSGRRGWLAATFTPLRDTRGEIIGVIGLVREITPLKQEQDERVSLVRELAHKNKELQSMIYAASHDLRTPLLNVSGFADRLGRHCQELLRRLSAPEMPDTLRQEVQPLLDDKIPAALHFIQAGATKMDALLNGLLQVSRVGRVALTREALAMNPLLERIIAATRFQVEKTKAVVTVEPLPPCRGDPNQINQLFSNLIDNALKYRDTTRPLKVRVTGEAKGNMVLYCVEDTGRGIDAEHQERIWGLFQRMDPRGSVAGEGIGLTLVQRIAELHGGRTWVESQAGVGSRFFVELPLGQ